VALGSRKDWGGQNLYRWLAHRDFPPDTEWLASTATSEAR
jgi:hypothetical protein